VEDLEARAQVLEDTAMRQVLKKARARGLQISPPSPSPSFSPSPSPTSMEMGEDGEGGGVDNKDGKGRDRAEGVDAAAVEATLRFHENRKKAELFERRLAEARAALGAACGEVRRGRVCLTV
jgi:hypothetical protein